MTKGKIGIGRQTKGEKLEQTVEGKVKYGGSERDKHAERERNREIFKERDRKIET